MGRAEVDVLTIGAEIATGAAPLSRADQSLVRTVSIHREYLLIGIVGLLALEDQLGTVSAPIRLRILPTESQLPDISKVILSRERFDEDRIRT